MSLLERPSQKRGLGKERILRVLLNHDREDITTYRVSKLADVSEPWCREYTEKLSGRYLASKGFRSLTMLISAYELVRSESHIFENSKFLLNSTR